jgi:hypothetical protein
MKTDEDMDKVTDRDIGRDPDTDQNRETDTNKDINRSLIYADGSDTHRNLFRGNDTPRKFV